MSVSILPLTIGSLAGYGKKKTGKNYYGEQAVAAGFGTVTGLFRALSSQKVVIPHAGYLLVIPAMVGSALGIGNMLGQMIFDVR